MEDKRLVQIFFEFLIGIIMIIPLNIFNSDQIIWNVIMKLLYSFGIMLAITKIMSIVYRMISCIFREAMVFHQKSYVILYITFICIVVAVWNIYSHFFIKGYFAAEIVAFILFSFWFLLDIHTTKCFWYIIILDFTLKSKIKEHKEYVDVYKRKMNNISDRKDRIVKKLETYFPKKFFRDPLKELRKNIDLSHIDKYLQQIPSFQGAYKGINGFLYGQTNVYKFENAIENYLEKLNDDEQWMDSENQLYDGYISEMEKLVETIQKSGKRVETLDELGFDSSEYRKILEGDILDAGNNRKSIKQFWKVNKKINKMRRKNYGK